MNNISFFLFSIHLFHFSPVSYGPFPVNRAVQGILGNAALLESVYDFHTISPSVSLSNSLLLHSIRDGILMHTGLWPDWDPSMPMPNSHGCIHGHVWSPSSVIIVQFFLFWPSSLQPDDINKVWQILVGIGVQIRPNTFGALPYPYKPQGLLSVEQIDWSGCFSLFFFTFVKICFFLFIDVRSIIRLAITFLLAPQP